MDLKEEAQETIGMYASKERSEWKQYIIAIVSWIGFMEERSTAIA
jgi:hypothetical protein